MANEGRLARVQMRRWLEGSDAIAVWLPRAMDRLPGTSVWADEAVVLAVLARWLQATNILEIGTWDGNTALMLAHNLDPGGRVVTVDLPGHLMHSTHRKEYGRQLADARFLPETKNLVPIRADSLVEDWRGWGGPFDLIFIDGDHGRTAVLSDSCRALTQLKPVGAIVWHDYGAIDDVTNTVDGLDLSGMRLAVIDGTKLAVGLRGR